MPEAPNLTSGASVTLDDAVFAAPFNGPLVHQSVRHELNARRQGTSRTKTRGEVSGGGAKPWRQKGTGRARAGSNRSPIWTGGGTVFGPQPRHFTFKVNRKEKRAALRSALSLHGLRGSVATFDPVITGDPSTKAAAALLAGWADAPKGSTVVVLEEFEARASLSFRNLERVTVVTAGGLGVADVVGAGRIVLSTSAVTAIVERVANRTQEVA